MGLTETMLMRIERHLLEFFRFENFVVKHDFSFMRHQSKIERVMRMGRLQILPLQHVRSFMARHMGTL